MDQVVTHELSEHDLRLAAGTDAVNGVVGGQVLRAVIVAALERLLSDFLLMICSLSGSVLHRLLPPCPYLPGLPRSQVTTSVDVCTLKKCILTFLSLMI